MNFPRCVRLALLFTLAARVGMAQTGPPVRPLGPVLATSLEHLGSVSQVVAIADGRVLVNDISGRRVLMFDPTLTSATVIADTTSATGKAYGSRLGGLVSLHGDSTLFVDPTTLSMLVIDPKGRIVRTLAIPRPNDANFLIGGPFGTPGVDAHGRLIYTSVIGPTVISGDSHAPPLVQPSDSALIVRLDLASRRLDTVAKYEIPRIRLNRTTSESGVTSFFMTVNPMPWTDDWALLSNGAIAIVRGREYRVDILGPDGRLTSAPKMDFAWQRLSDENKVAVIDSAREEAVRLATARLAEIRAANPGTKVIADSNTVGGRRRPESEIAANMPRTAPPVAFTPPPTLFVTASEIPDYRPAFRQGSSRGDADGNLWVRTSRVLNGGTVYDIVNSAGKLTHRVLVPAGRFVAGFGPDHMVYMGVVDGASTRLERAQARLGGN